MSSDVFDKNKFFNSLENDVEFCKHVLGESEKMLQSHLKTFDELIENKSYDDIKAMAHKLKGTYRAIYAGRLSQLCEEIELNVISKKDHTWLKDKFSSILDEHKNLLNRISEIFIN